MSDELQATSDELRVIRYELLATSDELRAAWLTSNL